MKNKMVGEFLMRIDANKLNFKLNIKVIDIEGKYIGIPNVMFKQEDKTQWIIGEGDTIKNALEDTVDLFKSILEEIYEKEMVEIILDWPDNIKKFKDF